jgi:hypothetical protein
LIFESRTQDASAEGWALGDGPWTSAFWPESFARRAPMLLFAFDGALFAFRQNSPAFAPLLQLPP